jgi:glycosyltransferase involved in cell wall biosynthesis
MTTLAQFNPALTIITAVFNGGNLLEATIRSVVDQSADGIEFIVIDGGSTDGTLDLLRRYGDMLDLWVSEPDEGIYDAFNKGVTLAKGEWILFLGAGDQLVDRNCIGKVIEKLKSAAVDVQLAYGRVITMGTDGSFVQEENEPWAFMRDKWRGGRRLMPHHQGILERRSFLANRPFDTNYKVVADYKSFMQAIAGCPPLYIDCVITRVFVGGVSTAPRNSLSAVREILRLNRELGWGTDHLPHQLFYGLKSAVKTLLSVVLSSRGAMRVIDAYRKLTGRRKMWT